MNDVWFCKYLIVPFRYTSMTYQTRLISPWVFSLDCIYKTFVWVPHSLISAHGRHNSKNGSPNSWLCFKVQTSGHECSRVTTEWQLSKYFAHVTWCHHYVIFAFYSHAIWHQISFRLGRLKMLHTAKQRRHTNRRLVVCVFTSFMLPSHLF